MDQLKAPGYDFNPNLITIYLEVQMGRLQRIENTEPSVNIDHATGHSITNPTLLLGFIFQQLIGCKTADEAFAYYKAHKEEVDDKYLVDRIIRKIELNDKFSSVIKPNKKLRLALFMYYEKDWNTEDLKNVLFSSKNPTKLKEFEKISAIIQSEEDD